MEEHQKYCKHCGELIDEDCVVCPKCGKQVEKLETNKTDSSPIVINNSSSASAAASASMQQGRVKKHYSILLDLILIVVTCGLWIIWMLVRPKYEY